MALIRHAEARQIARDAIVLDLGDVRAQADLIMARAKAHAERTIEEARAERERILAGAHEQGYEAGFAEGREAGRIKGAEEGNAAAISARTNELKRLESSWTGALSAFGAQRDEMLDDAREALVRLACRIASRVTRRTIDADPSVVVDQVRDAAALLVGPSRLVVEVCPADEPMVREALPGVMNALGATAHAELRTNEALSAGSCVVRSEAGAVDASIESQLARIAETLAPGSPSPQDDTP